MRADAERWLPVPGWEGFYEVSDQGRVMSVDRVVHRSNSTTQHVRSRKLRCYLSPYGYFTVHLRANGRGSTRLVHRLVLEAFVGPRPDGMECRHLNGISTDNRLDNLRWDTHAANIADKVTHGTSNRGDRHNMAKLSTDDVQRIRDLAQAGLSQSAIARLFRTTQPNVSRIVNNKTWTEVR